MDVFTYWIGVLFAVIAGIIVNLGLLLQKQVVNKMVGEAQFMKSLIKEPRWIIGLILGYGIATVFYLIAIFLIGTALVPGLLALGIIVLAVGSIKIIGNTLKKEEILAIFLMIIATFLLSFSGLSIAITEINFIESHFTLRLAIFTACYFLLSIFLEIYQRKSEKLKGFSLAFIAGLMYSLTDFWVGIIMGIISHLFEGVLILEEIVLFIICIGILIITNVAAVIKFQQAMKYGVASNIATIQQVPINFTPIIVYLGIFLLTPPSIASIILLIIGSILVVICSYLLGNRQAEVENLN